MKHNQQPPSLQRFAFCRFKGRVLGCFFNTCSLSCLSSSLYLYIGQFRRLSKPLCFCFTICIVRSDAHAL
jgi:hypothetical protein